MSSTSEWDWLRRKNEEMLGNSMKQMIAASTSRQIERLSDEPGVAERVQLEGNETQTELLLKLVQASRQIKEEEAAATKGTGT